MSWQLAEATEGRLPEESAGPPGVTVRSPRVDCCPGQRPQHTSR